MRAKTTADGGPRAVPTTPPWLTGAAIGLAILSMAGSAVAIGAGLAVSQSTWRGK